VSSARIIVVPSLSAAGGGGDPVITSLAGSTTHGQQLILNGDNFLTLADFHTTSGSGLLRAWNPFTTALEAGGWIQDGQDPENCILSTASPLGGACDEFYRKQHVSANQGSIEILHGSNTTGRYHHTFYLRASDNSPIIGASACTKWWRRYLGPNQGVGGYNYYFGPGTNMENATNFVTPPASANRWYPDPNPFHPDAVWRRVDIIEFLGNSGDGDGTELFGSPDVLIVKLDGVELMRRGSGFPDNPQPDQGTDANDNQPWVGDPSEGQEGGVSKLGSHLCETTAGYFLDFAEALGNYDIPEVFVDPSPTYAGIAQPHNQIPLGWANGQITVEANRGRFSALPGNYAYVRNRNNRVDAAGFLIT
jgi:hypothetical protein